MHRRAIAAGLAALCCAHSAAADGATQALAAIGAAANFGLCLFLSAQVDDEAEAEGEHPAEGAYAERRPFVALGGATGVEFFDGDARRGREVGLGIAARVGLRCSERMSSELAYEWQEGFDVSGSSDEPLWTLTSNAKVHVLTGRVQPFALAGIGVLHGDLPGYKQRTDVSGRLGGGVDVFVTQQIAISLDASYVIPTGNVQRFDYVSVGWGLQYHF